MKEFEIVNKIEKNAQEDVFEVYFRDLTSEAQERLLLFFDASDPDELNWDVVPIAVISAQEQS